MQRTDGRGKRRSVALLQTKNIDFEILGQLDDFADRMVLAEVVANYSYQENTSSGLVVQFDFSADRRLGGISVGLGREIHVFALPSGVTARRVRTCGFRPAASRRRERAFPSGMRQAMTIGQNDNGWGISPLFPRRLGIAALRLTQMCVGSLATVAVIAVVEAYWIGTQLRKGQIGEAPRAGGSYGSEYAGPVIRLAVLGDSNALGVGSSQRSQTIPALLARGLSARAARPVTLDNVAASGAESRDLALQLGGLAGSPDITVILIGGNDVMHMRSIPASAALLAAAIRRLQSQGSQVVVGTCPDMGTIQALVPPLRYIGGWYSRVLAVAQTFVVLRVGGRAVAIGGMLGPQFLDNPGQMFATDHFHSSPLGYARAARLLLPSVCAAAGSVADLHLRVPHRVYTPMNRPWVTGLGAWCGRRAMTSFRSSAMYVDVRSGLPMSGGGITAGDAAAPARWMGMLTVVQRAWKGAASLAASTTYAVPGVTADWNGVYRGWLKPHR